MFGQKWSCLRRSRLFFPKLFRPRVRRHFFEVCRHKFIIATQRGGLGGPAAHFPFI